MSKWKKLHGAAYRKLKATREHKERKCAASLHVFLLKNYIAKAKCKDKDTEYTSKLGREKHGETANMVQTNMEIKVEEEFPAGINIVKEILSDNVDAPKKVSSSVCGKDRHEEGTDEVTGNKEQANTDCCMRRHHILAMNLFRAVVC